MLKQINDMNGDLMKSSLPMNINPLGFDSGWLSPKVFANELIFIAGWPIITSHNT